MSGHSPSAEPFGTYRVLARNIASDSDNKIHDDTVARQYGFAGGLVPGIAVFGYLTRPVVARLGAQWLARGGASGRFMQPCYDGEEITVVAHNTNDHIELTVQRPDGVVCARGSARTSSPSAEPDVANYPIAPLPVMRPPAAASALAAGTVLGTLGLRLDARKAIAFVDAVGDDLPLYRGADGIAHPALLLALANRVLARNVVLGPWIHTASEVTHYSLARYGQTISLRTRVAECFERKGHEFVVLDILVVADPDHVVQHIRHTAIYKPRAVS
ncbi:MAG: hypothetical protein HYR72_19360 [Deltaproteobacteria bacterium]|nr:hypothetical protein [Deltaproteobacteria bacterium]MBI3391237.1 hypothetical protein [Deltaproteobacteria bacterium]